MKKTKFKIGNKIMANTDSYYTPVGKIYRVIALDEDYDPWFIGDDNNRHHDWSSNFELVTQDNMERHYFKKTQKEDKFFKFCKENGADYMEDEYAFWIKPKYSICKGRRCTNRAILKLDKNGDFQQGHVNENCLNFESVDDDEVSCQETQKWMINILTMFQKWKPTI